MLNKIKEALAVNLIIAFMLLVIGGYSHRENKYVDAFNENNTPIYSVETDEKEIALMVNVYQGTEYVEEYLKLFKKENVKATFFVGGSWAAKNRETVLNIYNSGNELGNHGYNHKMHTQLDSAQSKNEIMRTNSLIKEITGKNCTLFAPPSGDVNKNVVQDAYKCGCRTIMWSCDTIDWRDQDVEKIYGRVKRNLKSGTLILMHPTKATLDALPDIIILARAQGYNFRTVGEMLE